MAARRIRPDHRRAGSAPRRRQRRQREAGVQRGAPGRDEPPALGRGGAGVHRAVFVQPVYHVERHPQPRRRPARKQNRRQPAQRPAGMDAQRAVPGHSHAGRRSGARRRRRAAERRFVAAGGHLRGGRGQFVRAARPARHRQIPNHHQYDRQRPVPGQIRAVHRRENGRAVRGAAAAPKHRPRAVLPGSAFQQGKEKRRAGTAGTHAEHRPHRTITPPTPAACARCATI